MTTHTTPRPARPTRRSPTELTFAPDRSLITRWSASEPDWLSADRAAALVRFDELPVETNQLYTTYVDLRAADLAAVQAYESPNEAPIAVVEPADLAGSGVTATPLHRFIADAPADARRLMTDPATLAADDRLAQLTRAAWNQGIVLRIPAGVRVERPIVLRWAVGAPGRALLTRTIIELGAGASATVLEELVPHGPEIDCAAGETVPQSLFTASTEIHLGSGATLDFTSLQELGPRTVAFQHRTATIGEDARLLLALAQLGGRLVRSRLDNRLVGDRSDVEQVEIVFGSDDQLFDLTAYTRHVGRDTTGNLLAKGALLDSSRSYMKGLITIEKSARGTDSFLGEFGMNLSKDARAVAIPSLEIDQPDCRRAAHSSSVGPIDESQVFYLQSRGLSLDEARKFIVLGFLEPVVARVPLTDAQDRLRERLEAKWVAAAGPATSSPVEAA
jgi:Fe-S cluster assembly scaffold protein SufB